MLTVEVILRCFALTLVAAILTLGAPVGGADTCLEKVGEWRYFGHPGVIATSGSFAYSVSGSAMTVLDVTDPERPRGLGFTHLPSAANDIDVDGDYAYVAAGATGLVVVDVSTPSSPEVVGTCDTPGSGERVSVYGDVAYVADGSEGLRVIDVSAPSTPVEIGSYTALDTALSVVANGTHAFVAADYAGLRVLDVSTPAAPTEDGFLTILPERAYEVALQGTYVYLRTADKLLVVDVSTPSVPDDVGTFDSAETVSRGRLAVSGNFAYLNGGDPDLEIVDISTPTAPTQAGSYTAPGDPDVVDLAVVGKYVLMSDHFTGVVVVDVGVPSSATKVATFGTVVKTRGVAPLDDFAYLANGDGGLSVIGVTSPTTHELSYDTLGTMNDVVVVEGHAYITDYYLGLWVFDVATPTEPAHLGTFDLGMADGLVDTGDDLLVVQADGSFQVVDISTPGSPSTIGWYSGIASGNQMAVDGGHLFIAGNMGDLEIVDISTPDSPVIAGYLPQGGGASGNCSGIGVSADHVYMVGGYGLQIVNVSIPSSPYRIGVDPIWGGAANGIEVVGNQAYVTTGSPARITIFDLSDPTAPVETTSTWIGGVLDVSGVSASQRNVHVTGLDRNFFTFDIASCPLFEDGFESGDASAWAVTVGR